ncbi:MAG: DUF167 domain-containing protein [Nitrosopumilus sp.]|nr:DUF167 domain-containing protein [Nitrosopumilus sp.]MDC4229686.1 DUF167 domain-containing protein [Nitrosopumilus sp.]
MGFRKNCIIKSKTNFKKILIYKVQVQFSKDFLKIEKDQVSMGIKSKPIKGEANKEIIKKIAKYFAISTTAIEIKSGHKSKEKIIEISQ